jgi:hypothetical protein
MAAEQRRSATAVTGEVQSPRLSNPLSGLCSNAPLVLPLGGQNLARIHRRNPDRIRIGATQLPILLAARPLSSSAARRRPALLHVIDFCTISLEFAGGI